MLLEKGGGLSKNWREIRDTAEETADRDVVQLIESYDIMKKYRQYLVQNGSDHVFNETRRNSMQVSKVVSSVMRKVGTVSTMPGSGGGRRDSPSS